MDELEKKQRQMVIEEAKTWLKTPYHHEGRIKGVGVDCGTLLCGIFENCGLLPHIILPHYPPDFATHSSEEKYIKWVTDYLKQVDRPPIPGDVIVCKFHGSKSANHGALIIDDEYLIHAFNRQGVTLGNRRGYEQLMVGVFSYWGV